MELIILARLEAATSRLEDMVPSMGENSSALNGHPSTQPQGLAFNDDHARGASPQPQRHVETLPPAIDDFDTMINTEVKTYVNISEEIGGLVAEQVGVQQEGQEDRCTDPPPSSPLRCCEPLLQNGNFSSSLRNLRNRIYNQRFTWRY